MAPRLASADAASASLSSGSNDSLVEVAAATETGAVVVDPVDVIELLSAGMGFFIVCVV